MIKARVNVDHNGKHYPKDQEIKDADVAAQLIKSGHAYEVDEAPKGLSAEEQAKLEAEEQAKLEAEEQAKLEAEEQVEEKPKNKKGK